MLQRLIPALLLLSISAGCVLPTCPTMPIKPAKPTLEIEQVDGGICLDRYNTYLLLDYIWQLEEGYVQ